MMIAVLERIHLVFKTHLDVGFTDRAARVVEGYFTDYIPRAIAVGRELRQRGGEARFVWTTGSWLIHEYLERADAAGRRAMEEAIVAGDIAWHALPFTLHSELADPSLFEFGLTLSEALDRRFGRSTIAGKMTDVPGHTIGIVPLLAAAGIRFLHIGVNAASTVPDVPPVFRWRHEDGSEVIVAYQGGGYGAFTTVAGVDSALAFAHTHDNQGPQKVEQVEEAHRALALEHPGVSVRASTLDAFARDLVARNPELPLVTDEIGDSWIHGGGTDPLKVARFRELLRLRKSWPASERLSRFSGRLLMVPEHTWGMDEKEYLDDYQRYTAADFSALRAEDKTRRFESSWLEQRAYVDQALAELGESPERCEADEHLAALVPRAPSRDGWTSSDASLTTPHFALRFDDRGALVSLVERGRAWASAESPLALVRYEVFSAAEYARFRSQYMVAPPHDLWWAIKDFTKPGIETAIAAQKVVHPRVVGAFRRDDRLLLEMTMPEGEGAPPRLTLELAARGAELDLTLQWFDKKACRLPEALWFSCRPAGARADGWRMKKLGTWVSPLRVVSKGNRTLHAVEDVVEYRDAEGGVSLFTADAPLVAPGRPSLLDFHDQPPADGEGVHVNLYNNVWGTNFPMWSEGDAKFRFRLTFSRPS
jgi:hypothetical protein